MQVESHDGVHVGETDGRILLRDLVGRCATPVGVDEGVEGNSRAADPDHAVLSDHERDQLGRDLNEHDATSTLVKTHLPWKSGRKPASEQRGT